MPKKKNKIVLPYGLSAPVWFGGRKATPFGDLAKGMSWQNFIEEAAERFPQITHTNAHVKADLPDEAAREEYWKTIKKLGLMSTGLVNPEFGDPQMPNGPFVASSEKLAAFRELQLICTREAAAKRDVGLCAGINIWWSTTGYRQPCQFDRQKIKERIAEFFVSVWEEAGNDGEGVITALEHKFGDPQPRALFSNTWEAIAFARMVNERAGENIMGLNPELAHLLGAREDVAAMVMDMVMEGLLNLIHMNWNADFGDTDESLQINLPTFQLVSVLERFANPDRPDEMKSPLTILELDVSGRDRPPWYVISNSLRAIAKLYAMAVATHDDMKKIMDDGDHDPGEIEEIFNDNLGVEPAHLRTREEWAEVA